MPPRIFDRARAPVAGVLVCLLFSPAIGSAPPTLVPRAVNLNDTCKTSAHEVWALPVNFSTTTAGFTDDVDLPSDVVAPTCTAPTNCTGAGPPDSLPRGGVYNGSGTGPDRAFRIRTDKNCTLQITMDPDGLVDLGLVVFQSQCSNQLSDCVCIDDTGGDGFAESVSLQAIAHNDYYIVVDGYDGGFGSFGLNVTETTATGCALIGPPELDVDLNGDFDPLTDGLLILRYGFGFTGNTLITGVVAPNCSRCLASAIEAYLEDLAF